MKYGIHWFRRDLRLRANEALLYNIKQMEGGTLGVFTFDKAFLSRGDFSVNRFQFFLESLSLLKTELQQQGGDLLFLDVGPEKALKELFEFLKVKPSLFTFSRDYEPFARKRDLKIQSFLKEEQVETKSFRDHLLIEPHELSKKNSEEGYQVYTPFSRRWLEIFKSEKVQNRIQFQKKLLKSELPKLKLKWSEVLTEPLEDHLEEYKNENEKKVTVPIPPAGFKQAFKKLEKFDLESYQDQRDFPSLNSNSQLSPYFKNGSLTIPQVIAQLDLKAYDKKNSSRDVFFSELIWREFYYHILYRAPRVENEVFIEKYKKLKWKNNEKHFEAWKEGKTGFPIVDAGMRELKQTGFMHNRVRMIVASFLVKDLLIDWRWGESYFMDQLLDGDLAANNGGWQWAASTGCDPQPYFRIFNPWSQSKKFDAEGKYIKKFVSELKNMEAKKLHQPIEGHPEYPAPIVDHKEQREIALEMYKSAK